VRFFFRTGSDTAEWLPVCICGNHLEAIAGQYATGREWVAHKSLPVGDWVQKPRKVRLQAPTTAESESDVSSDDALVDIQTEQEPEQSERSAHEKLKLLGQGLSASRVQKATKKRKRKDAGNQ